jgi:hypothetical protein
MLNRLRVPGAPIAGSRAHINVGGAGSDPSRIRHDDR